jgi:hypothetical protein
MFEAVFAQGTNRMHCLPSLFLLSFVSFVVKSARAIRVIRATRLA